MIIQQLVNKIADVLELSRDLKGRDSLPQHALIKPTKEKDKENVKKEGKKLEAE